MPRIPKLDAWTGHTHQEAEASIPDIPSFDKPVGTPMAAPFLMCWAYATSPDGLDLEPRPPGASAVATDAAGHSPLSLVPQ